MNYIWLWVFVIGAIQMTAAPLSTNRPVLKMASEARMDLLAGPEVGALSNASLLTFNGRINPISWGAAGAGPAQGLSVHFPIVQYAWTEMAIQFTPASNGTIQLKLMGPWAEEAPGRLYRQEVLWDAVSASGTTVSNGSFEEFIGNRPTGWEGGGVANAGPMPPFKGANYGRTWHNMPLIQKLTVTGGVPVTLRAYARSIPPPNAMEMKRIFDHDTLAHQAARFYQKGVNLGNYLEVPPGQNWAVAHGVEDLRAIKEQGFDHVRIPVGWHHYTGPAPEYKIAPEFFEKVDALVTNASAMKLSVIINIHHFDEFTSQPMAHSNKFLAIWRQVAAHYSRASGGVAFELLNEPKDAATTTVLNPIYAEAIKIIRQTNPLRTIFVGPGRWNSVEELGKLWLPPDDENIIVTVHCYEPFYFTHQSATWAGPDVKGLTNIVYPGPPPAPYTNFPSGINKWVKDWLQGYNTLPPERNPCSSNLIRAKLSLAREWSEYYGRPVHLGEFGCYTAANVDSRSRYCADVRKICAEFGIGWALWDWKAGFRYWDPGKKQPVAGMREALFPSAGNR